MSAVGLIINGKSNRSAEVIGDLLSVARRYGSVCAEVLDGVTGLGRAMTAMSRKSVDTLILAGGDGTMQAAFTDCINNRRFATSPRYVALPCGMTNVIANDCGLKGSPARALDGFLRRREKGEVRATRRPLLSVGVGGRDPVYGFFFGAGAFHTAVKFSRSEVHSKGLTRSLALVASVAASVSRATLGSGRSDAALDVEFADGGAPGAGASDALALFMVTTLNQLGSGIYPFWGRGSGSMVSTTIDYPMRRLLRAAPAAMCAKSLPWFEDYGYRSWRADRMQTRFCAPFVFDGEFFEAAAGESVVFDAAHNVDFLN